jgi:hypothetical protein
MTRVGPLAAFALALLAAACSNPPEPACPEGSILAELATVTRFQGAGRDLTDVVNQGEIADLLIQCKYDRRGVTIDLQLAVAAMRGPADRARRVEFDYFVAITDPQKRIIAKEPFHISFDFADNRTRVVQVEEIEPRIPLADLKQATAYEILIGFQLTPDEIAWNRAQKAQRGQR